MAKQFQDILIEHFLRFTNRVIIVRNADGFLRLPEIKKLFAQYRLHIFEGNRLEFRVFYELEVKTQRMDFDKVLFVQKQKNQLVEDIATTSSHTDFHLETYFTEFHFDTLLKCHLKLLNFLYDNKPLKDHNKRDTLKYILGQYHEIDTTNFNSRELVIAKWLTLYQNNLPLDAPVKAYLLEQGKLRMPKAIVETKPSLLNYLSKQWKLKANEQTTEINFDFPALKRILSTYLINELKDWDTSSISEVSDKITSTVVYQPQTIDIKSTIAQIVEIKNIANKNWSKEGLTINQLLLKSLQAGNFPAVKPHLKELNDSFQKHLEEKYHAQILPSNPLKTPKVVSKILDHLNANYETEDKIALIVIDGMAIWQYLLLAERLTDFKTTPKAIYSWIPSITQLSRQAIFRGSRPIADYKQNPTNEKKLWEQYWKQKGIPNTMVKYFNPALEEVGINNLRRIALVDTALDEKMHSSSDYKDLYDLTKNWIERTGIVQQLQTLLNHNFHIYLTTDHGNIQAKGWRNLKQTEKFGSNKSRSKRHLSYANANLVDKFIVQNPDLENSLGRVVDALYLKDDNCFSDKQNVTHGGSHFLEVLIPFVKITK